MTDFDFLRLYVQFSTARKLIEELLDDDADWGTVERRRIEARRFLRENPVKKDEARTALGHVLLGKGER